MNANSNTSSSTSAVELNSKKEDSHPPTPQQHAMDEERLLDNGPPALSRRDAFGFFFAGLSNNMSYVIMIAGAKSIAPSLVGLVYVCNIVPSVTVKLTGPYWFHLVPYKDRILYAACLMATSFIVVAVGQLESQMWLQLIGVAIGSAQSGFGEASYLSLAAFYDSRSALTAWSSGTGFAGIMGYGWVILFTIGFGASFELTVLVALILPVLFWVNYTFVLTPPYVSREVEGAGLATYGDDKSEYITEVSQPDAIVSTIHTNDAPEEGKLETVPCESRDSALKSSQQQQQQQQQEAGGNSAAHKLTASERFWYTVSLWPYMVPLFVVYFAEYAMQSGVWAAIGFPVTSKSARASFYEYSNWTYQAGVLISRSSGVLYHADIKALWLMPLMQLCMLVFFILDAFFEWWYNWSLLSLCFVAGLFGGAVYVGAFALIADTVPPHMKEFSLSAASLSDGVGIGMSNIAGIFIQRALYQYHDISD